MAVKTSADVLLLQCVRAQSIICPSSSISTSSSFFLPAFMSVNEPVLILISQKKLCHQLQVLPFLSVAQDLYFLLRSPASTSMNFHAAPGWLRLLSCRCGWLISETLLFICKPNRWSLLSRMAFLVNMVKLVK